MAVLLASGAHGQEPAEAQPFTLSVHSRLVELPVTVRNSKGELVQPLSKDDFDLYEDGRLQTIQHLDLETDRPLTLGLLVDMSGSVKNFVKKEHAASDMFFHVMLQKKEDTAFLVRFDDAVTLLQPPTSSVEDLSAALKTLEDPHPPKTVFIAPPGTSASSRQAGTLLYDSIVVISHQLTKLLPGRKAIVILTDGEDNGSQESLAAAIEATQEADTVVYTILYTDRVDAQQPVRITSNRSARMSGEQVLELLARTTGGHAYEISRTHTLERIYEQIAEEMRMQYTLSYVPDKSTEQGYRKIELKAKTKGLKVQTRFGYYAKQ